MAQLVGRFIVLEGGEGAGKTTQTKRLQNWLYAQNITAHIFREPGATVGGEEVRQLLVTGANDRWDPVSEALLYAVARRENLVRNIWPSLKKGDWVICDRFVDSTLAYQGYGRGLDLGLLNDLYKMIAGPAFYPDLTLLLDLPVSTGLARVRLGENSGARSNVVHEKRFENLDIEFHEKLRVGYHALAAANPHNHSIIDATVDQNAVTNAIQNAIIAQGWL
jgi:dTMP kinase